MIKAFSKMVSALPFSGKMSITPLMFKLYNSTDLKSRIKSYIKVVCLLAVFAFLHGLQAEMGLKGVRSGAATLVILIFWSYALINIAVSITQVYLVVKSTYFLFSCSTYPRTTRKWSGYKDGYVILMSAVTFGGQMIFMYFYSSCS